MRPPNEVLVGWFNVYAELAERLPLFEVQVDHLVEQRVAPYVAVRELKNDKFRGAYEDVVCYTSHRSGWKGSDPPMGVDTLAASSHER